MATLLWFSGLETGNKDEMTGPGANVADISVVTFPVRSGTYALKTKGETTFNGGKAQQRIQLGGAATTYFRGYFKMAGFPGNVGQSIVAMGSSASTMKFHVVLHTDGTIGWTFGTFPHQSDNPSGPDVISLTNWNLLEVKFVRDVSVGGMEVWLNGNLQVSSFVTDTTLGTSTSAMTLSVGDCGIDNTAGAQGGQDIYWDDLAFGTGGYIGKGQSVAIQGKSGAPTYDTWTKSTGTDASALWSDTPPNGVTNLTSMVAGNKQTMLVNNTALEAAIGAAATINGAAVLAYGKSASGSPTVNILRRIGGVDTTSGTRILNATDRFVPNGINNESFDVFVDTRANLAAAEIGANCNSSTILETIEDVWLLVDFVPPVPPTPAGASLTLALTLTGMLSKKLKASFRNTISVYQRVSAQFLNVILVTGGKQFKFRNTVVVKAKLPAFQNRIKVLQEDVVTLRSDDIQRPYGSATVDTP